MTFNAHVPAQETNASLGQFSRLWAALPQIDGPLAIQTKMRLVSGRPCNSGGLVLGHLQSHASFFNTGFT
jgi:hypothetical protein